MFNKQDNILIEIKFLLRLRLKFNKTLMKKHLIMSINHKKQLVKIKSKLLNKITILNIIKNKHQLLMNLMRLSINILNQLSKISITNPMLKHPKPNKQNKLKLKNPLQVNNKDNNNQENKHINKLLNKNNKNLKLDQKYQLKNNQLKRKVRLH